MPRKARIDYPGGVHHLIVRGIEIKRGGKDQRSVAARSVVSYWAVRELGVSENHRVRLAILQFRGLSNHWLYRAPRTMAWCSAPG
jgi:hypothetical protein